MDKKYIYIIAGILALLIILGMVFILLKPKNNNSNSISITGLNNQPVKTKDFISASKTYDKETVIFSDSDLNIEYDAASQFFQITFTNVDPQILLVNRDKAEKLLLDQLGVSQKDACNLNVREVLPPIDPTASQAKFYVMSFCPGGDKFP